MTIKRIIDGKEHTIELTGTELYSAYCEQSEAYHREDITSEFEDMKACESITEEEASYIEHHLDEALSNYERYLENGEEWCDLCRSAIMDVWYDRQETLRREKRELVISAFVASVQLSGGECTPIDFDEAQTNIEQWEAEGIEVPDEVNKYSLTYWWNNQLKKVTA